MQPSPRSSCLRWVLLAAACALAASAGQSMLGKATARLPNSTSAIQLLNSTSELAAYLNKPGTVCTGFLPTNQGMQRALASVGRYTGLLVSNDTLVSEMLNFHIVPGKQIQPAALKNGTKLQSRLRNESITVLRTGDKVTVYGVPALNGTLLSTQPVQVEGCLVYSIDYIMTPPSIADFMSRLQRMEREAAANNGSSGSGSSTALPAAPSSPAPSGPSKSAGAAAAATAALLAGLAAAASAGLWV